MNGVGSPVASFPDVLGDIMTDPSGQPAPELVSPQIVEMHTFRDAIDVNYQRMALTGEELSGVSFKELKSYQ